MKRKKLLFIVMLLLLYEGIQSQTWSYYKDFPLNVQVSRADYDNNGNLYIVTSDKEIWKKPLNGSWQKYDWPAFNYNDILIEKASGSIFLADTQQALVFTTDDGLTWSNASLTTNPISGFHEPIFTFSNFNDSNIFYAGGLNNDDPLQSLIYKYTFTDDTVSSIEMINYGGQEGYNNFVNCITQTNDGIKILVGTSNGVFTSVDAGENFQSYLSGVEFYKIVEAQSNTFYALVTTSDGQNKILKSIGGSNWTVYYESITNEKFTQLFFDHANSDLWIGTERDVFKIDNVNLPPFLENKNLNNVNQRVSEILKSNQNIYLFSSEYSVQRLNSDGWIQEMNGFSGTSREAIIGNNDKIFSIGKISPILSYTANDQWVNVLLPGNPEYPIWIMDSDGIGNVYVTKKDKIFKVSQQGAIQQIDISVPGQSAWIDFLYVSEAGNMYVLFANQRNKLYRSTNGGQSWQLFLELQGMFDSIGSVAEDQQGNVYYALEFNFAEFNYSTDEGATWYSFSNNNEGLCEGSMSGYLTEQKGKVIFFGCGTRGFVQLGSNVQLIDIPFVNSSVNEPLVINQNGFYTVSEDIIYKSTDNGSTWISMSSPSELTPYPNSLGLVSSLNNQIFVRTRTDAFNLPTELRGFYKLTETLSVGDHSSFSVRISPNPAVDLVFVDSDIELDNYKLFDLTGKYLSSGNLLNNQISVSNLSDGVYILKLFSKSGDVGTHKIVKN